MLLTAEERAQLDEIESLAETARFWESIEQKFQEKEVRELNLLDVTTANELANRVWREAFDEELRSSEASLEEEAL